MDLKYKELDFSWTSVNISQWYELFKNRTDYLEKFSFAEDI